MRIQFEFSAPAYRRLQRLQEATETSKAGVVRQALMVYEWLGQRAAEGKVMTISGGGETTGPIDLRLLVPLAEEPSAERE